MRRSVGETRQISSVVFEASFRTGEKRRQAARRSYAGARFWAGALHLKAGVDACLGKHYITGMKVLILFVAWCILFVLCWPVALVALILLPLVWLIALPFRLTGMVLSATFAFIRAVLFLPARLLGSGKRAA